MKMPANDAIRSLRDKIHSRNHRFPKPAALLPAALLPVMALALAAAALSPISAAYAAYIIQPGINMNGPTAGSSGSYDATSPDASDYASTGGVAQGSMTISTAIPSGCIDSMSLDLADPIVVTKDLYGYNDMVLDLTALRQKYPSLISVKSLGTTADGRSIYEATVGNTSAGTHVLITGATHAREYITSLLVMKQLEYLLQYAETGAFDGRSLKSWLNSVCLHFVPMVNPDGVSISQSGLEGLRSESLRETVSAAYANDIAANYTTLELGAYLVRWKANARGVNLNDNFNAMTSYINKVTDLPSFSYYYGTPGSEAETKALTSLVSSTHFKAVINYHSTGSVIYWDNTGNKLVEHCRDLANNISALTGYQMIRGGAEGGSFKAYLSSLSKPVTNLTVEVGSGSAPVSIAEFDTIWAQNKFVPYYTMKWASEKGK